MFFRVPKRHYLLRRFDNQDRSLGSQDFFNFITDFFAGDADFSGDGQTTSQDFIDYIGCFFAPPTGC